MLIVEYLYQKFKLVY